MQIVDIYIYFFWGGLIVYVLPFTAASLHLLKVDVRTFVCAKYLGVGVADIV